MGCKPIPAYANIFMSKIDIKILEIAKKITEGTITCYKHFLDDIFAIWVGTSKNLHKLFNAMNQIHDNVKFTMSHTSHNEQSKDDQCECPVKTSILFLDTSVTIENGQLVGDLYKKPTNKNQYLLPSSCHPQETTKSIPFSLSLRITRICSKAETREKNVFRS